jgi:hypothetical protein
MTLTEARIRAKAMYGEAGFAVLRGANKRICVIGFIDRTTSNIGESVDVATAPTFEEAFSIAPPSTAVYFLKKTAALQRDFLAAASALESALGFSINTCSDLSQLTIGDLLSRQAENSNNVSHSGTSSAHTGFSFSP